MIFEQEFGERLPVDLIRMVTFYTWNSNGIRINEIK